MLQLKKVQHSTCTKTHCLLQILMKPWFHLQIILPISFYLQICSWWAVHDNLKKNYNHLNCISFWAFISFAALAFSAIHLVIYEGKKKKQENEFKYSQLSLRWIPLWWALRLLSINWKNWRTGELTIGLQQLEN